MKEETLTKNQQASIKEKVGLKGVYRITRAKLETPEHFALNDRVTSLRNKMVAIDQEISQIPTYGFLSWFKKGKRLSLENEFNQTQSLFNHCVRELNNTCKTTVEIYENIVPTVGRAMIANNLTNVSPTNVMRIKYAELGSGTNSPANGDTTLQTSSYRNLIASITNASNVAYATAFFNATETTGTYREAGIFCDGSASAGTGVLLSRVAINVTKTSSETLTIDWALTIS